MATTPLLIRVSFKSDKEKIGLTNYSDLVIFDKNHSIIAIRLGGYPETVQAMSDAILGGCELELTGSRETISVNSKGRRSFDRKITHDGVYAEAMHCLRDDSLQSLSVGNGDENEKSEKETVKLKRSLYFFCRNDDELFAELDRKLAVPLIPEFKDYFISELKNRELLSPLRVCCVGRKFEGWRMNVSSEEDEIAAVLEDGLKSGRIAIPGADPDTEDVFSDIRSFTQYLKQFSGKIAYRIKKCFPPVYHPGEQPVSDKLREVNQYVANHTGYSLFDAQLGAAEALRQQLERSKLVLLVAECGTGKTKIGSAALYAYQHSSPKRRTNRKAFNVVICPSHIAGKWVRELHETIPGCFAQHVQSMSDVDRLYEVYRRENKTVYCILSKETARNGYMLKPAVSWNRLKKGFTCPVCGGVQEMSIFDGSFSYQVNADAVFFRNENSKNHKCQFCGEPLWEMLNPNDLAPERNEWVRIGGYGYVHRRFPNQALVSCKSKEHTAKIEEVLNNPQGVFPARGAYDRYPLSSYIKKRIRRIDALIVDELHQYSGESAQGQSMAELAGIAGKVIGMTATLVNGYAKGIFYLLFRLKSHLMLLDGQEYRNSRSFCEQYGVMENVYEVDVAEYNAASKASKHKVRERCLPGISPLVYSRFLMENAVFLSLADMGKELPDYEEIPLPVQMPDQVREEYERLEKEFKRIIREFPQIGNRIMSAYLNLLSAYPDQPYGHEPVYNPLVKDKKDALIIPQDTGSPDKTQPKDDDVLELVDRKIASGKRVIIYTAWTRLDTQSKLHKLLTERGIRTAVLDQKVPTTKREAWVDKRIQEDTKVLIVNPMLVETGLDLNAFTTLIFYNVAYNLYIFRQASRRSWRINQTAPKVEVYMFYYQDTMQQRALRLMASKLSAATVIEGNVSEEGLAAMSSCEDMTTQLARELVSGLKENVGELAESFRKMAIHGNRQEKAGQPQKAAPKPSAPPAEKPEGKPNPALLTFIKQFQTSERKPIGKSDDTGQLSIFDLLAS